MRATKGQIAVVVIVALSALLMFFRLDNAFLWDDEAQVGIIARNLLASGHMTGWDGRNLYAYRNGSLLDANLEYINPPLDVWLVAGSFKLLGATTFAERLPFAVLGLLCVLAFAFVVRDRLSSESPHWVYCVAMFALGTQFLLFARTGRYFTASILAELLAYIGYVLYLKHRRKRYALLLALAVVIGYYSSYLLIIAGLVSLFVLHVAFHRRELTMRDLGPVLLAAAVAGALTIPHAIAHTIWHRSDSLTTDKPWIVDRLELLWWNVRDLSITGMLPWVGTVLLIAVFAARRRKLDESVRNAASEWGTILAAFVVALVILSPQKTNEIATADLRYYVPILPFMAALMGLLAGELDTFRRGVGAAFASVVLACNAFTLTPFREGLVPATKKFKWLLPGLVKEEASAFPTSNSVAVDYLKANARQDDLVLTLPHYFAYPILFYMGDRIKLCCQIDQDSPLPRAKVAALHTPDVISENFPDWIIVYASPNQGLDKIRYYGRPRIDASGHLVQRPYGFVATLPVFWSQSQRPELSLHDFGPVTKYDSDQLGVHVLHIGPPLPVSAR